eukprot:m.9144 g.9144  ORF g.9144 m.9144 type:complete len:311 (+) comp2369_c0_seq1:23-955(+)
MSCLLVTGGYDNTLRLWRADNGSCQRSLQHADSQVNCLDISPDRQIIAAGGHTQIRFYEPKSASVAPYSTYEGHTNNITALGFCKTGAWMFSGSEDQTVKIWDVRYVIMCTVKPSASSESQAELPHQFPVTCAALHPNQEELFSGDQNGSVTRWDLRQNCCTEILIPVPGVSIRSICVSPDAQFMAAINNDGNCYVWRLVGSDITPLQVVPAHPQAFGLRCKFSPNGSKLITTSSDKTARIFDVANDFRQVATLGGHGSWVWDCAFSGDSNYVVTVSSDKVGRLWDTQGRLALELKGHQRAITAVALHDG